MAYDPFDTLRQAGQVRRQLTDYRAPVPQSNFPEGSVSAGSVGYVSPYAPQGAAPGDGPSYADPFSRVTGDPLSPTGSAPAQQAAITPFDRVVGDPLNPGAAPAAPRQDWRNDARRQRQGGSGFSAMYRSPVRQQYGAAPSQGGGNLDFGGGAGARAPRQSYNSSGGMGGGGWQPSPRRPQSQRNQFGTQSSGMGIANPPKSGQWGQ